MKVVVTGASGNLGTALLRAAGADWDVVGIARRRPDPPDRRVRWIRCDVGAPGAAAVLTEACAHADVLIHLAWAIHPRADQPPMHRTNTVGTANVLKAAAGVRHLVCASSVAAYTPAGRTRRVTEYQPCDGVPESAYSMGKAALETQLDTFERDHPEVRVARIRPCGVTQADAADQLANWLFGPLLPRRLLGRVPVPLWPALRLQVVHADDVARAIRLIVDGAAGGAFNLAAEPVLTARDLTTIIGGVRLAVPLRLLTGLTAVGWRLGLLPLHPAWLRLADRASLVDTSRARDELDWSPRHDAPATVREVVRAMRDGHRGGSPPLAAGSARFRLGRPSHQSQAT